MKLYTLFEKAVAKTSKIDSIKIYRNRTGLGLKKAKEALDRALTTGFDNIRSINQAEGLLLREGMANPNRKELYETAETSYMNRIMRIESRTKKELFDTPTKLEAIHEGLTDIKDMEGNVHPDQIRELADVLLQQVSDLKQLIGNPRNDQ